MSISEEALQAHFYKYGGFCYYCDDVLTQETFTLDHVIPVSKGGSNKPRNKVACCTDCNQKKGNAYPSGRFRFKGNMGKKNFKNPEAHKAYLEWRKQI